MKRLFKNFTYKEQVTLLYKWSFTNDFNLIATLKIGNTIKRGIDLSHSFFSSTTGNC